MTVRGCLKEHSTRVVATIGTLILLAHSACAQTPPPPSYGIGAPWPEANIDRDKMVVLNEVLVAFERQVPDERISFLIDSIAGSLRAAAYRNDLGRYTEAGFRWPPGLPHRYQDVLTQLDSIPEIAEAWPNVLLSAFDEKDTPPDSQGV